MGVLRLALALLICIMHAKAQQLLPRDFLPYVTGLTFDPKLSLFFLMAGFFARQALLHLQHKHSLLWPLLFWKSRAIRLWPVYWFCVAATYFTIAVLGYKVPASRLMPDEPLWLAVIYNLVPVIPESLRVGALPEPWWSVIYVLVVFQAWTLALIVVMFILAPLLMYRRWMYVFFPLSLAGLLHAYGGQGQHQGYVIIALPYFLAGGIAFDLYRRKPGPLPEAAGLAAWAGTGILVLMMCYHSWLARQYGSYAVHAADVGLAWVLLPLLFRMTRNNRYDLFASNLSYPLYLVHFLVFYGIKALEMPPEYNYALTIPACLLAAMALHYALERPLMRHRKRGFVPGSGLKPP